jgi:hypothetical protein
MNSDEGFEVWRIVKLVDDRWKLISNEVQSGSYQPSASARRASAFCQISFTSLTGLL